MKGRKSRVAGRWWLLLLPVVLFALAFEAGGTAAAASAGRFPAFIPMPGVTPRGVAVDKVGNVYVSASVGSGINEHINIWKYTPAGEELFSVDIGQGTIGGLVAAANGDLYIAMAAGTARGVHRLDRKGNIELLTGTGQIFFANGLAFDDRGTLYITESVSIVSPGPPPVFGQGGLWRIPRGGQVEECFHNELFTGTGELALDTGKPYPPIGANGIAYYHGNLYITNTEKGTVIQIPVWPDGSLGAPEVWTELDDLLPPESPLVKQFPGVMGDGLALDVHGNLYVAVLTRSAVVRLNLLDESQETVAVIPASPLDFPASLVFGTGKGERTNLFVTNLGMGGWVGPSLVKIDAGVPGRPLH